MLNKQDMQILESMMTKVVEKNSHELEERLIKRMDERFEQVDKRFEQVDKRFEDMEKRMDERFEDMEKRMEKRMDERFEESETFLLDEMDRYYKMTQKDIQKLSDKVDEIDQYYRIKKVEDNVSDKLLKLYCKQQEEIDEIKMVIGL